MKIISNNTKDTAEIAQSLCAELLSDSSDNPVVLCLSGNLGAGKTAFTKEIARHLGVREKVDSPTFVLMKKYPIKTKGKKYLYHLDAYRLKNEKELLDLGWNEIVSSPENMVVLEWPENVSGAMPKYARYIAINLQEDGSRIFELQENE